MKIGPGDKFRLVKGEGMIGQKHICCGTAIEPVSKNGHNGITLIKFWTRDYFGKHVKMAVPLDWVAFEPPNGPASRKRP